MPPSHSASHAAKNVLTRARPPQLRVGLWSGVVRLENVDLRLEARRLLPLTRRNGRPATPLIRRVAPCPGFRVPAAAVCHPRRDSRPPGAAGASLARCVVGIAVCALLCARVC
jgi:hypothetical protein